MSLCCCGRRKRCVSQWGVAGADAAVARDRIPDSPMWWDRAEPVVWGGSLCTRDGGWTCHHCTSGVQGIPQAEMPIFQRGCGAGSRVRLLCLDTHCSRLGLKVCSPRSNDLRGHPSTRSITHLCGFMGRRGNGMQKIYLPLHFLFLAK
jgi:hypothetical protein